MAKMLLVCCLAVGCGLALSHWKQASKSTTTSTTEFTLAIDSCHTKADLEKVQPDPAKSRSSRGSVWESYLTSTGQQVMLRIRKALE